MHTIDKNRVINSILVALSIIFVALSRLVEMELWFYAGIVCAFVALLLSFRQGYGKVLGDAAFFGLVVYAVKSTSFISPHVIAWAFLVLAGIGLVWESGKFILKYRGSNH
jgi:hypothetical protein